MTYIHETLELTHTAALEMLSAAIAAAESIDSPSVLLSWIKVVKPSQVSE